MARKNDLTANQTKQKTINQEEQEYLAFVASTLDEWASENDDEDYQNLQSI